MSRSSFSQVLLVFLFALAVSTSVADAQVGAVFADVPDEIDAEANYLIYLHGRIIETQGRRPTHPRFGVYEYDVMLEEFARRGYQVISEARPADTEIPAYAEKVAHQVRTLADAGVAPERITIVGFSKGGMITIATSSTLRMPHVQYVILAGCTQLSFGNAGITLTGRVLSIHEESDDIGLSCAPLFERSSMAGEKVERLIHTGAKHGSFYLLRDAWVEPMFTWIEARTATGVQRR